MSYHTRCDWCGEVIGADDDRAVMPVTIKHPGGRSTLHAKWAEETRPTMHFCASPVEDTDDGGMDRAGLIPDEQLDSCFDRAVALMTGTTLRDPGFGMEWRLVQVDEPSPTGDGTERVTPEMPEVSERSWEGRIRDRWRAWADTSPERREALVFQALGDDRLTLKELRDRVNADLDALKSPIEVFESHVRSVVMRLFRVGKLERERETFKNKPRYRYFQPAVKSPDDATGRAHDDSEAVSS